LNLATAPEASQKTIAQLQQVVTVVQPMAGTATISQPDAQKELSGFIAPTGASKATDKTYAAIVAESQFIVSHLTQSASIKELPAGERTSLRTDVYVLDEAVGKILKKKLVTDDAAKKTLGDTKKSLDGLTKYIPLWVKVAVALALGCGTMIGWKRIVVTVGEKIGKAHLTYAQGFSAEIVAYATIQAADMYAAPVSTTHVLSSGIAGTMAANGSGLQKDTLISILLAWVLTLPVCVFLGATLFSSSLYVMFHVFGIH
jgi:PiT family inorganic phosphate transporter